MLSFSQCEYSSTHYCTIVYMTMFTFNLLCLHSVLFTITLHSILIVLCIYILSFHNDNVLTITITLHCNNVYSERSPFTYSRVYNYTIQYTDFAVYICCPFHNVIFFHNYCTIDSTTMSIAYPEHIHTVLFTITLPSILYVLLHMLPFHNVIFFHNYCTIDSTTMSIAYP